MDLEVVRFVLIEIRGKTCHKGARYNFVYRAMVKSACYLNGTMVKSNQAGCPVPTAHRFPEKQGLEGVSRPGVKSNDKFLWIS